MSMPESLRIRLGDTRSSLRHLGFDGGNAPSGVEQGYFYTNLVGTLIFRQRNIGWMSLARVVVIFHAIKSQPKIGVVSRMQRALAGALGQF